MVDLKTYTLPDISSLQSNAEQFLRDFPGPQTFLFFGAMGAGKTTFINALCNVLGIDDSSSPTFSIVNEYVTSAGEEVLHFDLYRLKSLREAYDIGFEEYLDRKVRIFIEWPEKCIELISPPYVKVELEIEKGQRKIAAQYIAKES